MRTLTHSLTHSFTQSLNHTHTHSLTHSLPHSLTYTNACLLVRLLARHRQQYIRPLEYTSPDGDGDRGRDSTVLICKDWADNQFGMLQPGTPLPLDCPFPRPQPNTFFMLTPACLHACVCMCVCALHVHALHVHALHVLFAGDLSRFDDCGLLISSACVGEGEIEIDGRGESFSSAPASSFSQTHATRLHQPPSSLIARKHSKQSNRPYTEVTVASRVLLIWFYFLCPLCSLFFAL